MFYISNTLDLTILRVYTEKNYSVLYEVTDFFATGGIQLMALSMVSINSDWVSCNWLKFNDVKAVMWWVIKAHVTQVDRYTFSNSK